MSPDGPARATPLRPRPSTQRSETGGPLRERFWNLPNTITVVRTGVVPVLLLLLPFSGPQRQQSGDRLVLHRGRA